MQSQQIVAHHSSRSSTGRNTQRLPLLAGLFYASLTGCILEQRNGSSPDIPDLTTLPDLRADLSPPPDLAAPCGSDGILFMGKCIYDFYQPDATSCAGKSITLYKQGSQFKQICDCVCDKSALNAELYYGVLACGTGPLSISATAICTNLITSSQFYKFANISGSCSATPASRTDWFFDTKNANLYCNLSTEEHRRSTQECILIDGIVTKCPMTHENIRGMFTLSPQMAPDQLKCNCCINPADYPGMPIVLYSGTGCTGSPLSTVPQMACIGSQAAQSAKWNPSYCPDFYSKTLPAISPNVVTQTVCCKQP